MSSFQNTKQFFVELTDLSKDALHVYVGLGVMLLVVILFRKSLADWRPIAAVAVASVAGEIWDLLVAFNHDEPISWNANWKDVWNTIFWPTMLFVLARFSKVLKR